MIGFSLFIAVMLVIDLKLFRSKSHVIQVREALVWTSFWVGLALLFNLGIFLLQGRLFAAEMSQGQRPALEFLTAYIVEESLSVDNLFVFLIIFSYFQVPPQFQRKVLFWGILGAIVMRAAFILLGTAIIQRFQWAIYVFGAFLIYTGIRLAIGQNKEIHPEKNPILKLVRRFLPVSDCLHGDAFMVKINGRLLLTPLIVVLTVVETTDVVFAVDSIPAVLGVTRNPFIAYTSNMFAVLGLRSIFFALSGMMQMFRYLSRGLAFILTFIGAKMLVSHYIHVPIGAALGVVVGTLAVSIVASLIVRRSEQAVAEPEAQEPLRECDPHE